MLWTRRPWLAGLLVLRSATTVLSACCVLRAACCFFGVLRAACCFGVLRAAVLWRAACGA
jgi:hypothetical protein